MKSNLESLLKTKVGQEPHKMRVPFLAIPVFAIGQVSRFVVISGISVIGGSVKAFGDGLASLLATKPNQPPK